MAQPCGETLGRPSWEGLGREPSPRFRGSPLRTSLRLESLASKRHPAPAQGWPRPRGGGGWGGEKGAESYRGRGGCRPHTSVRGVDGLRGTEIPTGRGRGNGSGTGCHGVCLSVCLSGQTAPFNPSRRAPDMGFPGAASEAGAFRGALPSGVRGDSEGQEGPQPERTGPGAGEAAGGARATTLKPHRSRKCLACPAPRLPALAWTLPGAGSSSPEDACTAPAAHASAREGREPSSPGHGLGVPESPAPRGCSTSRN